VFITSPSHTLRILTSILTFTFTCIDVKNENFSESNLYNRLSNINRPQYIRIIDSIKLYLHICDWEQI